MLFVIDRIQGDRAVLIGDDDTILKIPRRQLPPGAGAGTVFRIQYDNTGHPDWSTAEIDGVEQNRRLKDMKQRA
jgi:hypothetical protein